MDILAVKEQVLAMAADGQKIRTIAQGFLMPKTEEEKKDAIKMANCTAAVEVLCSLYNIFSAMRTGGQNSAFNLVTDLVISLNTNPFWVRNAGSLMPLMIAAVNASNDARELLIEASPRWSGLQAQSENLWVELFPQVDFLCNGYAHMRLSSVEMKKTFLGLAHG